MRAILSRLIFNTALKYILHTRPHPGRGLLAKLAWRCHPQEIPVEIAPDVRLWIRLDQGDEIEHLTGTYESDDEARTFVSHLAAGMTVVDIGANIGLYALLAGRAVGPTGIVIAFEPVPDIFARLEHHISVNGLRNVVPHRLAISDTTGSCTFFLGRYGSLGSLFRKDSSRSITVPTETLDSFLHRNGIRPVDAVKIDAEGAEMHVVRGMERLLVTRPKPLLMVEIAPPALQAAGSSADELFAKIVGHGYEGFLMRAAGLQPVTRPARPTYRGIGLWSDNYLFTPVRE